MRVGVADHVPWTQIEGGRASGVEVEILKDFAEELGAEISFIPGTTPELLEATRQDELDVMIGGFTDTFPGVSEGRRPVSPAPTS
jgi:polar amino acid transport system substrate-binding protein